MSEQHDKFFSNGCQLKTNYSCDYLKYLLAMPENDDNTCAPSKCYLAIK